MAFASSPAAKPNASGCSPVTVRISPLASRRSKPPSRACPVRSCVVDGKAIVVDERGLSVFDILRYRLRDHDDEIEGAQQSEVRPDAVQKRPLSHSASLEPGKSI